MDNATFSEPLFGQFFPEPDGRNGYEDYIRAVDLLRLGNVRRELHSLKPTSPSYLRRRSPLWEESKVLSDWVLLGNRKEVWEPRAQITPETIFPEYAELKRLANVMRWRASVSFVEGEIDEATKMLVGLLEFGQKVGCSLLISYFVGFSTQAMAIDLFSQHRLSISGNRCVWIADVVSRLLVGTDERILALLDREAALAMQKHLTMVEAIRVVKPVWGYLSSGLDGPHVPKLLNDYPSVEGYEQALVDELNSAYARFRAAFRLSETDRVGVLLIPSWIDTAIPQPIMGTYGPEISRAQSSMRSLVGAELLRRTKLRLVRLHARFVAHKATYGAFPMTLDEVATAEERLDRLEGAEFAYEPGKTDYLLYSRGHPPIPEVDLRTNWRTDHPTSLLGDLPKS